MRRFTPNVVVTLLAAAAVLGAVPLRDAAASGPLRLTTTRVASGLLRPVALTAPPGDLDRLFIVEQHQGRIRIVKNGSLLATPFLDIRTKINTGDEQGLLGLAFHPDYAQNGYFYVNYTGGAGSGRTFVARYQVSANPDVANAASEMILINEAQPYSNHNGGWLDFGPDDGYLYVSLGDGGFFGDPGDRAQSLGTILGKILRLDVDGGTPYAIPADNPFVGVGGAREEIWAWGLRNAWRCSFDRETADLWIADVGQNAWEEVNFEPASSPGGVNYGWRCREGLHPYDGSGSCTAPRTDPIHEYAHGGGRCSVTGGYVYRGCAIPELQGTYFFGDYCSNEIFSFRYDGATLTEYTNRTVELAPGGGLVINSPVSFGEDAAGELYVCDLGGEVFKIVRRNDADVTVTLIPTATGVMPGERLTFDVSVVNRTAAPQTVTVWIDAFRPPLDTPYATNPILGPRTFTIGANRTITRTASLRVPGTVMPSGPYALRATQGTFPGTVICDTDCFKFNVIP